MGIPAGTALLLGHIIGNAHTLLLKIVEGDKAKWDAAAAKAHEHANKTELDKIAEGDKANLDAVVAALTVGTF